MSEDTKDIVEAVAEKVEAVEASVVEAVKKVNSRRVKSERKPRGRRAAGVVNKLRSAVSAEIAPEKKDHTVNFDPANWMNLQSFNGLPVADRFQTLFAEAGSRGQEAIEKSRKAAEELADLTRANVDAAVEAGSHAIRFGGLGKSHRLAPPWAAR